MGKIVSGKFPDAVGTGEWGGEFWPTMFAHRHDATLFFFARSRDR